MLYRLTDVLKEHGGYAKMIAKKATNRSKATQAPKTEYARAAAAALIVTLILGSSVIVPQAAALESADRGGNEITRFSSQTVAIDYYLDMA